MENKQPRQSCLCYKREFQNFSDFSSSPGFTQFFDTIEVDGSTTLDKSKYAASVKLSDAVQNHLGASNYKPYFIAWPKDGLSTEHSEFRRYLKRLTDDFVRDVCELIQQQHQRNCDSRSPKSHDTLQEVIFHARQCVRLTRNFQGQKSLLAAVERFLRNPRENNKPFIVYGDAGGAERARSWRRLPAV